MRAVIRKMDLPMSTKHGIVLLVVAGIIATSTAVAHLSCIYLGPQCYSIQMAPQVVIESAQAGTLLAPLGTIVVATIFLLFAAYAFSAAGLVRKLPFLKVVVNVIGILCIVRGILPLQLWLRHPEKVSQIVLNVGLAWLAVGLCFSIGYKVVRSGRV